MGADEESMEDLREQAEFYRAMFEVNTAIKLLIDPSDGTIVDANPAAAAFYGFALDELRGMKITQINVLSPEALKFELARARTLAAPAFHFKHKLATGEIRDVDVYSGPVQLRGRPLLVSIIHDVTERNQLEERLRRAQRLDAIGRLAAGVAHDFNNLLAISLASLELAEKRLGQGHPALPHLADVKRTIHHGASLTQQMLVFARQGEPAPARVDLRALIAGTAELLRKVLGTNISVTTELAADLPSVRIDPSQLELAFLNLALNARDAMPDGGTLTIRAAVVPDDRVCITVADTGRGMDAETRARAFEPFFSTKPIGDATGLGLATVYGMISQSEGEVALDSAPGAGTRVHIFLPPYDRIATPPPATPVAHRRAREILLVDDRDDVRVALADALVDSELVVHTAGGAHDALAQLEALDGHVDVVLSDVAMPERSGVELAADIKQRWPHLPVVLMSGHRHPPTIEIDGWLAKPFTIDDVISTLDRVTSARAR